MFELFSKLLGGKAGDLVKGTMDGLDKLITSDDERLKAKAILEKQVQDYNMALLQFVQNEEKNITARHTADMTSDSWLSKNIRPLSLIFILGLYTAFSFGSAIKDFEVNPDLIQLLGEWGMMIMSFYFGGRSLEKVSGIMAKSGSPAGAVETVTGFFGKKKKNQSSNAVG